MAQEFLFQFQRKVITTESFYRVVVADDLKAARAIACEALEPYNSGCPDDIADDGEGQNVSDLESFWTPGVTPNGDSALCEDQRDAVEDAGYVVLMAGRQARRAGCWEAFTPAREAIWTDELFPTKAAAWIACARHMQENR